MAEVTSHVTAQRVRRAHGDAWQAVGAAREETGGGVEELAGVRLMATGLPHPQWNNGDVHDPAAVDLREVRDWYSRLDVPWGMRVPAGADWRHGRRLFRKRLMGATPASFREAPDVAGLELRAAGGDDLDSILAVDVVAFDESPEVERPWLQLLLDHPGTTVAVATLDGTVVATGSVLRSDGWEGPAAYVAGIAVEPAARRRGIGAAVTSWLMQQAGDVDLWHLHPDTDAAARIYERLGFVEVEGLDIYIDL
ncbi:MAG TPA: GNAT family N-acetyltransferase [Acidimicrobiales bacterium]|nr:GNAT family N-acetyltransferase [Acidimicrobiales bacterium]